MNKKELIDKYKYLNHDCFRRVDTSEVLEDLKQLDEPQKLVVPQFVADWYEEYKDNLEYNIWNYIYNWETRENSDFKNWLDLGRNNPIQTLVNMHQFGYEVEKEKRYYVKTKKIADGCNYLNYRTSKNEWSFAGISEPIDYHTRHTRKNLEEAGVGWVFDCPGVEIEEVEE